MESRVKIKQLGKVYKEYSGRNNYGRITIRHRGNGNRNLRIWVDNMRNISGIAGKIIKVQRDNKRTGYVGLVRYSNGYLGYILLSEGNKIGDYVMSAINGQVYRGVSRIGSVFMLKYLKEGNFFYNLEVMPYKGGRIGRSGGSELKLLKKFTGMAKCLVKMPSEEYKNFSEKCRCTLGYVSNMENRDRNLYKAGQNRWLGLKPHVRGEAMNPVDHPHGGRTKGGRVPVSAWGKLTKGVKTVNNSNRLFKKKN
jgi:large subunit ribosomal protein L2